MTRPAKTKKAPETPSTATTAAAKAPDEPTEVATRHISPAVTAILWGRAGGRCEFAGCNQPLWRSPVTQEAREVKTSQEVALFRMNGPIVVEALAEFEAALRPGITERELFAVYAQGVLRRGAEYLATNTVCSGPNTNPWRAEATDREIGGGDLVYIDTDTVGIEGCFFCVSRTFVCGGTDPTPDERVTFQAAHDWVRGMTELVRPGITCGAMAAANSRANCAPQASRSCSRPRTRRCCFP